MKPKSRQQLRNEELQRRLTEAEETLQAIRSGAVDALVVSGSEVGTRIYTLEGADRPYRLLIEQMQQGAATLHPDGTVAYCNPRLAELLGVGSARVTGAPLAEYVAVADRPWLEALLRDGCGGTAQGETHLERVDGLPIPVYLTVSALHPDAGAPLCVLVTDLTDAKFEDLYERAPDMMCSVDAITGNVLQCNETLARELGYAKPELLGRHVLDLYTPACRERAARNFRKFVSTGAVHDDALQLQRRDGRSLDVSLSVSAVRDASGRIVRSRSVLRDITDRKRAEDALRDADRRKDEFLAILAHELRNPLAPIRNAAEILRVRAPDDPHLEWSAGVINRQLEQLTRLVDDLLDVSRITRNKIELRRERVTLSTVVQRAVEGCQPLLEGRRHYLEIGLPTDPIWLEADAARVAQVLCNLLTNAGKYTPDGGQISLRAEIEGNNVCIRVRDNGIGIAPEVRPHIFDMFVQAQAARERSQGGLGIGLTLVRSLVEMHGGSVEVRSDGLGCGSEFVVRLPLAQQPSASAVPAEVPARAQSRRVLVVDDNKDAAETLAALLSLLGHEVETAASGAEAISRATARRPDVILMDLGMPNMNGYEAGRRILEDPELADTMLIALTGWGQESDRHRTQEAGFAEHLTKPVNLDSLQRLLSSIDGDAAARRH